MDLYDIAVARKLSSGGGGGSSDFSTAEVTFTVTNTVLDLIIDAPIVDGDGGIWSYTSQAGTYTIAKGDYAVVGVFGTGIVDVQVTGDISADSYDEIYVTGDGTINIVGETFG